jgi:hypothetical protein
MIFCHCVLLFVVCPEYPVSSGENSLAGMGLLAFRTVRVSVGSAIGGPLCLAW